MFSKDKHPKNGEPSLLIQVAISFNVSKINIPIFKMTVFPVVIVALVLLVLWLCLSRRSEGLTHNTFLTGSPSWELNPEWEKCAPCFAKCAHDQWTGKLQPDIGETNKDVCARRCAKWCQGFQFRWSDSIHVGFTKHGM